MGPMKRVHSPFGHAALYTSSEDSSTAATYSLQQSLGGAKLPPDIVPLQVTNRRLSAPLQTSLPRTRHIIAASATGHVPRFSQAGGLVYSMKSSSGVPFTCIVVMQKSRSDDPAPLHALTFLQNRRRSVRGIRDPFSLPQTIERHSVR
jgi:hypothetical protein